MAIWCYGWFIHVYPTFVPTSGVVVWSPMQTIRLNIYLSLSGVPYVGVDSEDDQQYQRASHKGMAAPHDFPISCMLWILGRPGGDRLGRHRLSRRISDWFRGGCSLDACYMLICFITFQEYVGGPKLDLPISKAESASRVVRLANVANNKFRKHGTLAMNMLIIYNQMQRSTWKPWKPKIIQIGAISGVWPRNLWPCPHADGEVWEEEARLSCLQKFA